MEHLKEKMVESELIYSGKFVNLRKDRVTLPDGATAFREVVEHPGAAAIIPITSGGEVVLVRQWRYPVDKVSIELPAGKLSPGEEPLACAQRELAEETGFAARRWQHLLTFYTSPGFSSELMHLFLADKLVVANAHPDDDEFVEPLVVPLAAALEMVETGEICDAKSIIGLLEVARILQGKSVER
ncbi:MAG: NUDIX hydrolase [Heliobacteriaceae bacterium]|nr:NUDIX hydrolase [Heliobacteriaceae bacterium]MDD4587289.1 NUDIX hydrolase [Heliobacteriaceae bacterium]